MKITEKTFHDTCSRGWCGNMGRGAGMGRGVEADCEDPQGFAHLIKIRLDSGGYAASGGVYFGHGEPLYWLYQESGGEVIIDQTFRAVSRAAAVAHVAGRWPGLKVRK